MRVVRSPKRLFLGKISLSKKRKQCGICEGCKAKDFGGCRSCCNMIKFGGIGEFEAMLCKTKMQKATNR